MPSERYVSSLRMKELGKAPSSNTGSDLDRERALNDCTNTGVMAALVGGFALGSIQSAQEFYDFSTDNQFIVYILSVVAVHACTCSAITSALLYREINFLEPEEVAVWTSQNAMMMMMPMMKFAMGCGAYLLSVIYISLVTLEEYPLSRNVTVIIGIMSMSTVVMTLICLMINRARRGQALGR